MPLPTKTDKPSKQSRRNATPSARSKVAQRDSKSLPKLRGVDLGWRQFLLDLRDLLPDHEGKWVVYHQDKRIEFGDTRYELFQRCYARGWKYDEFYVGCIEPLDPSINVDDVLTTSET